MSHTPLPPLRENFFERLFRCVTGLACFGTGIAFFVRSELGVPPWDVFHQGVSHHTGLGLGTVLIIVAFCVLLLWIPLRLRPGLGTLLNAIVCNIGHFDNEIDMAGLARSGATRDELKAGTDLWTFPDSHAVIVLAEGRLVNLGCATGHPSFVMSCSFSNQVIAQIELFTNLAAYPLGVYVLPKHLDEKVAFAHLEALGVKLTQLTDEQAEYMDMNPSGPFKPEHYRY